MDTCWPPGVKKNHDASDRAGHPLFRLGRCAGGFGGDLFRHSSDGAGGAGSNRSSCALRRCRSSAGVAAENDMAVLPPGDRYVISNELGQVIVRPEAKAGSGAAPVVSNRKFITLAGGGRLRSITLNFGLRASEEQPERLATIVYSAPADALDNLLKRMTILLCAVGLGGAVVIGAVAAACFAGSASASSRDGGGDWHHR
jgi:hypothetical protein